MIRKLIANYLNKIFNTYIWLLLKMKYSQLQIFQFQMDMIKLLIFNVVNIYLLKFKLFKIKKMIKILPLMMIIKINLLY